VQAQRCAVAKYEFLYDEEIPCCTIYWLGHFVMMLGNECVTVECSVETAKLWSVLLTGN